MESPRPSPSPLLSPSFPQGVEYFDGHIENGQGVFGVHFGDPLFLLDIPHPKEATAPDGYNFRMGDFRRPLWINPIYPYLLLLPRSNPFYGPLFSCLNVTSKNVPIEEVVTMVVGEKHPRHRWGLPQTLIDRWLHLESLLRLTLWSMMDLHGGRAAEGVYTFLNPIFYRYTERNASSPSNTIEIAMRSRDAFLPLMAHITLMFLVLDAHDPDDWRAKLHATTKLHWQWMAELEHSAVGDFSIDRLGGIIDLTQSKSHLEHRLPRHICWLFPHLLGRQRVPLYFFYGRNFPPKEPIPEALVSVGFVPTGDEIEYLRGLPGDVTFSQWSVHKEVWKRLGRGAPPSTASSTPLAPTVRCPPPASDGWGTPVNAESSVPAISFPAVERDSGQKLGEDVHAFMERRRLHNEQRAQRESPEAKRRRLAQEDHASAGAPPGKKGARVFIWEEEEGGFFVRRAYNRTDAADRWDEFTPAQRVYDSFSNQWDLCTELAPHKEAEPSVFSGDDDDDFRFYEPTSTTNLMPLIPDVPGRKAMEEETGESATQVLERAYNLGPEDLSEDADNLPGWQKQDVLSTVSLRFGFAQALITPSSSPRMQDKVCAWAVGDEHSLHSGAISAEARPRRVGTGRSRLFRQSLPTSVELANSAVEAVFGVWSGR
ncbi:hypothetical protein K438DRAFT_653774 [Mycena galopus ATCC 62051]|nr:hypothetical protein K438DRAFT_653774 [Mycena galopus ATCC 62051]